jgi:hypothetical protein
MNVKPKLIGFVPRLAPTVPKRKTADRDQDWSSIGCRFGLVSNVVRSFRKVTRRLPPALSATMSASS